MPLSCPYPQQDLVPSTFLSLAIPNVITVLRYILLTSGHFSYLSGAVMWKGLQSTNTSTFKPILNSKRTNRHIHSTLLCIPQMYPFFFCNLHFRVKLLSRVMLLPHFPYTPPFAYTPFQPAPRRLFKGKMDLL